MKEMIFCLYLKKSYRRSAIIKLFKKVITIKQSDRKKNATLSWTLNKNQGEAVGTNRISGVALQRRTPINVFVPLDDPEAVAFVRGGLGGSEERKAKLKDMLEASNELMIRLGLEPNKTSPGDIELASADWPKGDPSKAPPPIYKPGGGGRPNVPGVPQPFRGQPGPKYPMA